MTLIRTEGVVLVDDGDTFDGRRQATDCYDWVQLRGIGPSRGFNRILPGVAGTSRRDHVRGELAAEIQWRFNGNFLVDGSLSMAGARDRVDEHLTSLLTFLDGADGRQLQVRLFRPSGVHSTSWVTFKAAGTPRVLSPTIYEVPVLLAVPAGIVARAVDGS
jgi:hypothetical protein